MWHLNCIRFCPTYPLLFHSGIFKASMADFTNQCACILSVLSASPLDRYRPWRSFWQCFHKSRQLYCRRVFNILFPSKICSDISSASDRTFCQFLPAFWRHAGFLLSVRICWIPSLSRHKRIWITTADAKNYRILPTRYASSFCSSSEYGIQRKHGRYQRISADRAVWLGRHYSCTFLWKRNCKFILSSFAAKAKQSEVRLTIDAKLPDSYPFSDTELCSLLSNTLENAIHASKQITDISKRIIHLRMFSRNNKLLHWHSQQLSKEPVFHHGLPCQKSRDMALAQKAWLISWKSTAVYFNFQSRMVGLYFKPQHEDFYNIRNIKDKKI